MLSDRYDDETLLRTLLPRDRFRPYPTFADPEQSEADGTGRKDEGGTGHEWDGIRTADTACPTKLRNPGVRCRRT